MIDLDLGFQEARIKVEVLGFRAPRDVELKVKGRQLKVWG